MHSRNMEKFTKNSKLSGIINSKKGPEILAEFGVPCPTCPFFAAEAEKLTIGDVCKQYGINLEKLLEALNKE